ncbi:hypothetical protein GKC29_09315 [Micromonospora sp. WMMC415]|nr:hypothetical protein GKC29_09315 [Micromonospora sp. WMMC415]
MGRLPWLAELFLRAFFLRAFFAMVTSSCWPLPPPWASATPRHAPAGSDPLMLVPPPPAAPVRAPFRYAAPPDTPGAARRRVDHGPAGRSRPPRPADMIGYVGRQSREGGPGDGRGDPRRDGGERLEGRRVGR